jgi:hypothetical protein
MLKHGGTSLVVCHKAHKKFWTQVFNQYPDVSIGTYGALKGLNQWTHCTSQFIVGTPFVPDIGIRDLAAKLGHDVSLERLSDSARLKKTLLLASNEDTAVVNRRFYPEFPFHSALALMKSQWEVTQAVRLRLYNKPAVEQQHLYIFSNVELKSMYANEYHTLTGLAWKLNQEANAQPETGRKPLELEGVAYEKLTAVFDGWPKGRTFMRANLRDEVSAEDCGDRYLLYWIQMAIDSGWAERVGKAYKYVKLVES